MFRSIQGVSCGAARPCARACARSAWMIAVWPVAFNWAARGLGEGKKGASFSYAPDCGIGGLNPIGCAVTQEEVIPSLTCSRAKIAFFGICTRSARRPSAQKAVSRLGTWTARPTDGFSGDPMPGRACTSNPN
jgi:hypothetical protein